MAGFVSIIVKPCLLRARVTLTSCVLTTTTKTK